MKTHNAETKITKVATVHAHTHIHEGGYGGTTKHTHPHTHSPTWTHHVGEPK